MAADGSVGLSRYARLLRVPGASAVLLLATLARLPIGMTALALLLLVQRESDSFAAAGIVAGAYSVALAVSAPVRGSAVDRQGAPPVLLRYGAIHPVALVACAGAVLAGLPTPVLAVAAAFAGGTFPPVGSAVRSLWGVLYDDDADRTTAYALDAVLIEVAFVSGPLVVGLAVAVASPVAAVLLSAGLVGVGTVLLSRSPATALLVAHAEELERPPLRAPLQSAPVRRLLFALLVLGVGFGATEVSVAAFAVDAGADHLVGPILAMWALGSVIGGLGYGARAWPASSERQYPWLLTLLALGLALPLAAGPTWSVMVLLLLGGAAISPFSACNSALLARAAPAGTTSATFSWSGSGIVAGIALGSAAGGWLVEHVGTRTGFGLAAAAGAAALLMYVLTRSR